MLDATIKAQLKAYLEKLQTPIELVASLDGSAPAQEMRGLLQDIKDVLDPEGRMNPGNLGLVKPPSTRS